MIVLPDDDILENLKRGDETALRQLVESYYTPLCVYAVQFTDSLELAEDIVQDFFLRLWERKLYLTVHANLKGFLFNAIRNAAIDTLRKKRPFVFCEIEEEAYWTDYEWDEEEIEAQRVRLHHYLCQLSPQEYRILMEVVVHNKKYKEVAEELGISVNTVKTHLANALRYLRSCPLVSLCSLFYL